MLLSSSLPFHINAKSIKPYFFLVKAFLPVTENNQNLERIVKIALELFFPVFRKTVSIGNAFIDRIDGNQHPENNAQYDGYDSCDHSSDRHAVLAVFHKLHDCKYDRCDCKRDIDENLEKKRELWGYIKRKDLRLFHHLRNGILGQSTNLPGRGGRKISIAAYKITQKVVGFN